MGVYGKGFRVYMGVTDFKNFTVQGFRAVGVLGVWGFSWGFRVIRRLRV